MRQIALKVLAGLMFLAILIVIWLLADATVHDFRPDAEVPLACTGTGDTAVLPDTLSLVTWNIGYAGLGAGMDFFYDGGTRVRPGQDSFDSCQIAIRNQLKGWGDADFILLQEVDQKAKRSYWSDQVAAIAGDRSGDCALFAPNYNVRFVPVPLGRAMGQVVSGIMTLGGLKPSSASRVALPGSFGWPKRLFMPDRCLLVARYLHPSGKHLVLINIHNSAFDDSGALRDAEMEEIRKLITEEYARGNFVIAGGDWNMNPPGFDPGMMGTDSVFSVAHGVAEGFMPEGWKWGYDPEVPTNRDVSTAYRQGHTGTTILDFFLLSPNVKLSEVKTVHTGFLASDHHPVTVRVILDPGTDH